MSSPMRRSRRRPRQGASPRLLHHLQALLALSGRPAARRRSEDQTPGRSERRRRQHLALSQRLLDPLPEGLRTTGDGADRFWSALRWGGCGMVVALILTR